MTLGILGAGQLSLMLIEASKNYVNSCVVWDPESTACAGQFADFVCGSFLDPEALALFLKKSDMMTWEFENIPAETLKRLKNSKVPIYPTVDSLLVSQDRLQEKQYFRRLGIPTAPFLEINTPEDLQTAATILGYPFILKSRRNGYDGKSQVRLKSNQYLESIEPATCSESIAEGFVQFEREVSIIAARDQFGGIVTYDLVENLHRNGILIQSTVLKNHPLQKSAEAIIKQVLDQFGYIGVLTIEFFVCGDRLIVNEMAPRVHNSGHWSIEGAKTSQFENHIRCVTGHRCGPTTTIGNPVMRNLIGESVPQWAKNDPNNYVHWYNKSVRPGRKCGHITRLTPFENQLEF